MQTEKIMNECQGTAQNSSNPSPTNDVNNTAADTLATGTTSGPFY